MSKIIRRKIIQIREFKFRFFSFSQFQLEVEISARARGLFDKFCQDVVYKYGPMLISPPRRSPRFRLETFFFSLGYTKRNVAGDC